MKCPVDGAELTMSDRNGIEIDYCPQCRGVWLDRGELDKIIERDAQFHLSQPAGFSEPPHSRGAPDPRYDDRRRDDNRQRGRRRGPFLDDIFDFG
jgi:Zn-finger nucleic acid-binding protein